VIVLDIPSSVALVSSKLAACSAVALLKLDEELEICGVAVEKCSIEMQSLLIELYISLRKCSIELHRSAISSVPVMVIG
jgi:hypothetical protein